MLNEFIDISFIFTFGGMVIVLGLIVQFTKSLIKRSFADQVVRLYAFCWAIVLVTLMFWYQGRFDVVAGREIAIALLMILLYSISVTIASMGGYDVITDFKAEKTKNGV